ncbi:hypothetical protein NMY22_g6839 [Coprinellus aureogranulatus]|nr:hypothetical protein NMY22_g6839 [Coprinellus aureogranulatus]
MRRPRRTLLTRIAFLSLSPSCDRGCKTSSKDPAGYGVSDPAWTITYGPTSFSAIPAADPALWSEMDVDFWLPDELGCNTEIASLEHGQYDPKQFDQVLILKDLTKSPWHIHSILSAQMDDVKYLLDSVDVPMAETQQQREPLPVLPPRRLIVPGDSSGAV